jgi:TonB family protein
MVIEIREGHAGGALGVTEKPIVPSEIQEITSPPEAQVPAPVIEPAPAPAPVTPPVEPVVAIPPKIEPLPIKPEVIPPKPEPVIPKAEVVVPKPPAPKPSPVVPKQPEKVTPPKNPPSPKDSTKDKREVPKAETSGDKKVPVKTPPASQVAKKDAVAGASSSASAKTPLGAPGGRGNKPTGTTDKIIKLEESATAEIMTHVRAYWILPPVRTQGDYAVINIKLSDDGKILSKKIIRSSGNDAYNLSALMAVESASPYPMPSDAALRKKMREIDLTLNE